MSKNSKEYNKAYYERMKEKRKPEVLKRQKNIRDYIQKYKLERGCVKCGYNKCAQALQFHHLSDDKEHDICRMTSQGRALKSIMEEIKKCILVCANCHAEIHAQEI